MSALNKKFPAFLPLLPGAAIIAVSWVVFLAPAAAAAEYYNFNDTLKAAPAPTPAVHHPRRATDETRDDETQDDERNEDSDGGMVEESTGVEDGGYAAGQNNGYAAGQNGDYAADQNNNYAAGQNNGEAVSPGNAHATQPAQNHVVTSVMKCYEQIGRTAALKIRENSLTPYADCQKQLRAKTAAADKAAADKKSGADKDAADSSSETPQNFIRVREKDVPRNTDRTAGRAVKP